MTQVECANCNTQNLNNSKFCIRCGYTLPSDKTSFTKTFDQKLPAKNEPRKIWIALLFALIQPGFGQFYNGQFRKAILFNALILLVVLGLGQVILNKFHGLVILLSVLLGLNLFYIIDAIINAAKQNSYIKKSYNSIMHYMLFCFISLTLYFGCKHFLSFKFIKVSSNSNEPTILLGDDTVINNSAFNSKEPSYGDLILFEIKPNGLFCSRIVGLPNDRISIKENNLLINNIECNKEFIQGKLSSELKPIEEFEVELPNGHKHRIFSHNKSQSQNSNEITVPPQSYFVLSDNRDFSRKSLNYALIKRDEIIGKIIYTYWGTTKDRINIDLEEN